VTARPGVGAELLAWVGALAGDLWPDDRQTDDWKRGGLWRLLL